MPKVIVLENNPSDKITKEPIEIVGSIALDGRSFNSDFGFKLNSFDEIVIQKVNGELRGWDCILICKKYNCSVAIYTANFNDGFFI